MVRRDVRPTSAKTTTSTPTNAINSLRSCAAKDPVGAVPFGRLLVAGPAHSRSGLRRYDHLAIVALEHRGKILRWELRRLPSCSPVLVGSEPLTTLLVRASGAIALAAHDPFGRRRQLLYGPQSPS
jgi:hypothetical protein